MGWCDRGDAEKSIRANFSGGTSPKSGVAREQRIGGPLQFPKANLKVSRPEWDERTPAFKSENLWYAF